MIRINIRMVLMKKRIITSLILCCLPIASAHADDYTITIKDHQFSPQTLSVPAGQKVKLSVVNSDTTPAEFESVQLNREKIVPPGSTITLFVGPLEKGEYAYFNDFHREASGTIAVK